MSDETVEYFQKISNNPFDNLAPYIAPHLIGPEWYWIRRAILMILATQKDMHTRNRLHMLLVGKPGTGKSIKGDTKILVMMSGKIQAIMIKDLENKSDYKALSVNPITLKTEWKKVYHFTKHIEKRKVLKIETRGKQTVIATKDHSFLKYDFGTQQLIPIKGDELSVGDIIPFISRFNCENIKRVHYGFDHTFAFGFFVGLWIAEGCIQKENVIRFASGNKQLLETIGEGYNSHIYKYVNRVYDMQIFDNKLKKYLQNFYISYPSKKGAHNKKIPEFIFHTPESFRKGLISGYFTGDGTVEFSENAVMTTASNKLAYGISNVLNSLSISSRVRNKTKKTGLYYDIIVHSTALSEFVKKTWIPLKHKHIKLQEALKRDRWQSLMNIPISKELIKKYGKGLQARDSICRNHIGTIIEKNCNKGYIGKHTAEKTNKYLHSSELQKLIDADIHWTPITNIDEIESDGYVYDISVKDNENFVLENGMVVHNTEICLWMREHLQAIMINAELTSKVGLVGDARGNSITPGLLADADENLLLTDELDKASTKDQSGLLQAMEEGYFSIIKGKHRERFKAEVRVIATANLIEKIQKPLLDRFDFVFYVHPCPRRDRAGNVDKLINSFMDGQEDTNSKLILEYIDYIGDYDVKLSTEHEDAVRETIKDYILGTKTDIEYVSYRSLELSILRIAYAMAKLEMTTINDRHVKNAIWLKDHILKSIITGE